MSIHFSFEVHGYTYNSANNYPANIGEQQMTPTHVFTLNNKHPPNVDHSVVLSTLIFKVVQSSSDMTVTIITAYIVHTLFVGPIRSANTLVVIS